METDRANGAPSRLSSFLTHVGLGFLVPIFRPEPVSLPPSELLDPTLSEAPSPLAPTPSEATSPLAPTPPEAASPLAPPTAASPPAEISPPITISRSLRALVIGINKYKNAGKELQDLNGCVADADDMYRYLTETRGMPSDSILRLDDNAATRANILEGIRALRDSSAPPDDPIIIFWAGHGARGPAPPGWNTSSLDGEIEMLIPYDFDLKGKGEGASGLLDYQLGRELSELAHAKGDNIIVILDTCHAGSATRDQGFSARGFKLPDDYEIHIPADDASARSRDRAIASSWHSDRASANSTSHVLLAGTSSASCAYEREGRGAFTLALLGFLREHERLEQLTYSDVIDRLPKLSQGQHPQCEGRNADRHVFSMSAPDWGYRCHLRADCAVLEAGEAQGITKGALFDLYATRDGDTPPILCDMRAEQPGQKSTTLRFSSDLPAHLTPLLEGWARQTITGENVAKVSIAIGSTGDVPGDLLEELERERPGYFSLASTEDKDHQMLVSKNIKGNLVFDLTDEACRAAGLQRLRPTVPANSDHLRKTLVNVGDFFECLRRSSAARLLREKVSVEAHLLGDYEGSPIGNNLLTSDGTFTPEYVYEDEANGPHQCYGFTIKNNYTQPLYFWIFVFNMNDLSIDEVYRPAHASGNADPCVAPNDVLTIGYGNGGVVPQAFFLPPGEDTAVAYLKIFVSPSRLNLSHVKRSSAFTLSRPMRMGKSSILDRWDTLEFPIVQKKRLH